MNWFDTWLANSSVLVIGALLVVALSLAAAAGTALRHHQRIGARTGAGALQDRHAQLDRRAVRLAVLFGHGQVAALEVRAWAKAER